MIQTLLDAIHRQQIEQYEDEKVYELDCRNPKAEDSDVLLITLAAEFLGLQKTIELAHACHAKVVSLILWDPKNERTIPSGSYWPRAYRTRVLRSSKTVRRILMRGLSATRKKMVKSFASA